MEYIYNSLKPELVETMLVHGMTLYTVNAFIEKIEENNETIFRYVPIPLPLGVWRKDELISGLIKAKYTSDLMDAVRNNYELVRDGAAGDKTEEYTEKYNKMQAWRAYSKQLASEIIEEKERQHGN